MQPPRRLSRLVRRCAKKSRRSPASNLNGRSNGSASRRETGKLEQDTGQTKDCLHARSARSRFLCWGKADSPSDVSRPSSAHHSHVEEFAHGRTLSKYPTPNIAPSIAVDELYNRLGTASAPQPATWLAKAPAKAQS